MCGVLSPRFEGGAFPSLESGLQLGDAASLGWAGLALEVDAFFFAVDV